MRRRSIGHRWPSLILALTTFISGLGLLADQMLPMPLHSMPILDLADWQEFMILACLLTGGGLWAWSCLAWFKDLRTLWMIQRMGSELSALAWNCYSLAIMLFHARDIVAWVLPMGVASLCWRAVVESFRSERRTRKAVEQAVEVSR